MDILTALRSVTEQAEVYAFQGESTVVTFEANEMKSAEVEEVQGIALRGIVGGRLGFTAAAGQIDAQEIVENLLTSARYGDQVSLAFPPAVAGPEVAAYDPATAELSSAQLAAVGREVVELLRQVDADGMVSVEIERAVGQAELCNSAGAEVMQKSSSFSVGISVERVRGDDVLMVFDGCESVAPNEDYHRAVERLIQRIRLAQRSASLRSGHMPVLFAPQGAIVLALPLMLATDGKNVYRGTSPLAKRVGEQVFDRQLGLWDDPTVPGRPNSSSHDDEGVPCYRKALIADGRCEGFLFDLKTAALMGTHSTGNGSRGGGQNPVLAAPQPDASSLIIAPGDRPMVEILAGIEHGLLVENVLGLGQGNAISGAFSNTLGLAYVIERGEIAGRVKNVSIAGNVYQDLRAITAISQESQWVYGSLCLPYILLPDLNVVCER